MRELSSAQIDKLRQTIASGKSISDSLPEAIGGCFVAGGMWRFFSQDFPPTLGISGWNSPVGWRSYWKDLNQGEFFFGEDVFGNQLMLRSSQEQVFWWNHETGESVNLELDSPLLIETVHKDGLEWTGMYPPEAILIANDLAPTLPLDSHLHWVKPLILGGIISMENVRVVPSIDHLKGHGKLWNQLRDIPPGTRITINR